VYGVVNITADKSETGWLAVDKYESDELAEDSADEKRIRKAQEKATRKKKENSKQVGFSPRLQNNNLLFVVRIPFMFD